jgi:hypothetical protein
MDLSSGMDTFPDPVPILSGMDLFEARFEVQRCIKAQRDRGLLESVKWYNSLPSPLCFLFALLFFFPFFSRLCELLVSFTPPPSGWKSREEASEEPDNPKYELGRA